MTSLRGLPKAIHRLVKKLGMGMPKVIRYAYWTENGGMVIITRRVV